MQKRTLAKAHDTWALHAGEQKRLKLIGVKVVERIKNRYLAKAHDTWALHAKEQKRLKLIGVKVVVRMQHKALGVALETWTDRAVGQRRLERLGAKAVQRMLYQGLSQAFDQWHLGRMAGAEAAVRDVFEAGVGGLEAGLEELIGVLEQSRLCYEMVTRFLSPPSSL